MKLSKLEVETSNITQLASVLSDNMDISYQNQTEDMIIIAAEKYKFRTNSTQMNMIIIKRNSNNKSIIDIIGAAGGTGIFNFSLWAESSFVKSTLKTLSAYCTEQNIGIHKIA